MRLLASELQAPRLGEPEDLARFLSHAQRLSADARAGLAAAIFRDHGRPLARLVDEAFPEGTDRRQALGRALVRLCGGIPAGIPARALETMVAQSLQGFAAPAPPARDAGAERVPAPKPPSVWVREAATILAPRLRGAGDALRRLEAKVELARTLLSTVVLRSPRNRFGVEQASALLEKAQLTAGLARVLLRRDAPLAELGPRAAMSRREVTALRPLLYEIHEVLALLARRSPAVRPTPGEIGDIDRAAQAARESLNILQALADLLLELSVKGGGSLTPGDVRALGLAYEGAGLPPQVRWNGGSDEERAREEPLRPPAAETDDPWWPGAADLLAALKASKLELAQVDPVQLRPAARSVAALPPREREERLRRVVDTFHRMARTPRGTWSPARMASYLAGLLRVPTRALRRLSDAEVRDRFQEVLRAQNAGPGTACVRIGDYLLTFEADEVGLVVRSSRTKKGVLSRAARAVRHSGPLTVTTLRHYRATEPLGRFLAGSIDTGEWLGRFAYGRLANAGAALLRTAATRGPRESTPAPVRLDRVSRELEDVAVMNAAVASYHAAERAAADARRALSLALASRDPSAVGRAKRRLEAAEEAKRVVLQDCANGLLHAPPADPGGAFPSAAGPAAAGALARTETPARTERPTTTGASLSSVARQLRQTRTLAERVQQTAHDLHDLAERPDVPDALKERAARFAQAVEQAVQVFHNGIRGSDDEASTQAARLAFEERVLGIIAAQEEIFAALATLQGASPTPPTE